MFYTIEYHFITDCYVVETIYKNIENKNLMTGASRSSRRSSWTSDACSSKDQSPIEHKILNDLETQAKALGHSVDKMLSDVQHNLHNVCMRMYLFC